MLNALMRILALARKELLAVLKDPRGRVTLFVPPIIQCLVFGYAATFDLNHVSYTVLDQDRSQASQALIAGLDGSGVFERVPSTGRIADAKDLVDHQGTLLVVQIGPDFERRLLAGKSADIQVIADGRNSNTAATALGYVNAVVAEFNAGWRKAHGQVAEAVRVTNRAWYNANLETRWHIVPSMTATLTLIEILVLTAMSVAREREQGTLDQLLVTPFRPVEIMAGKALPSILIGLVQAGVILLVAQLWFHIPFAGSYLTLFTSLFLFLLAAVGTGLLVSLVAANLQQALLFSFLLVMPFVLLSGLFTPISSMPRILQFLTMANPLRYAIDIAQRVYLEGAGLATIAASLLPLALVASLTLSTSSWMFRNRLT